MEHVWNIVMAGGVGARFWPVSRAARPKQLQDLFGQGPLLRTTIERTLPLVPWARQVVVTGEILREPITEMAPELPLENLLCEPKGRNTAAAIAWGALHIERQDPEAVVMVLPSDHFIGDLAGFQSALSDAIAAARTGKIVTVGIVPTHPETGFGYIQRGEVVTGSAQAHLGATFTVAEFKEKPDHQTALSYLADGGYYWNAGMFFFPVAQILDALRRFEPELMAALDAANADGGNDAIVAAYPSLKSISIDYAVMERSAQIQVVPRSFGWSDVGSWRSLYDLKAPDASSAVLGDVIEIGGGGNVLFAEDGGLVATVGVRDLAVVHTADATFVCHRDDAQRAREVVDALKAAGREDLL